MKISKDKLLNVAKRIPLYTDENRYSDETDFDSKIGAYVKTIAKVTGYSKHIHNLHISNHGGLNNDSITQKALAHASKHKDNKAGSVDVLWDVHSNKYNKFLVVVETKLHKGNFQLRYGNKKLSMSKKALVNGADNGAVWYAKHMLANTPYSKIIAVGTVPDESSLLKNDVYLITNGGVKQLHSTSLGTFASSNFDDYMSKYVYHKPTSNQLKKGDNMTLGHQLSNELRNDSDITPNSKALFIASILLAMMDGVTYTDLPSKKIRTNLMSDDSGKHVNDGQIIYRSIKDLLDFNMTRKHLIRSADAAVVMRTLSFVKSDSDLYMPTINGFSVLRIFMKKLEPIYHELINQKSNTDLLGDFFSIFTKQHSNAGKDLGIVLTPTHLANLMVKLLDIKPGSTVADIACGTGTFLVSALRLISNKLHVMGVELQPNIYTILVTNLLFYQKNVFNLLNADAFNIKVSGDKTKLNDNTLYNPNNQPDNPGLDYIIINPPYSQGKKGNHGAYELRFLKKCVELLKDGGKLAIIMPSSIWISGGKNVTKPKLQQMKKYVLSHCKVLNVITTNPQSFYPTGTQTAITILQKDTKNNTLNFKQNQQFPVRFINFEHDGYYVKPRHGLVPVNQSLVDKRYAQLINEISVYTPKHLRYIDHTVDCYNEWLYNFYYVDKSLPVARDFAKSIADFDTFKYNMIIHQHTNLFANDKLPLHLNENYTNLQHMMSNETWKPVEINTLFTLGKSSNIPSKFRNGYKYPYISAHKSNNGLDCFIDNVPHNKVVNHNVIGVNNTGNGGVGIAFYHPYNALFSSVVNVLIPNQQLIKHWNTQLALFLCTSITHVRGNFSHGYSLNNSRQKALKIMLPMTASHHIDWDFINDFMNTINKK